MRTARFAVALLIVLPGCGGGGKDGPAAPPAPLDVDVTNVLDVPVNLTAGATPLGSVPPKSGVTVTLPAGQRTLSWRPWKRTFSSGEVMADDFTGADVAVSRDGQTIDIVNNVGGVVYFTPYISNFLGSDVSFALFDAGTGRCLGWQGAPTSALVLPLAWGYYRLTATTTLRVYANRTCSGAPIGEWSTVQLQSFEPNNGVVRLRIP